MRCPKCHAETSSDALNCPSCNLVTPKGRLAGPAKGKKSGSKAKSGSKRKIDFGALLPGGRMMSWIGLVLFIGAAGFLAYWYVYATPDHVAPQSALSAMNQLRGMPSKQEGKTIDDCLVAEMKKSKESGQLVGFQGWTVKPYQKSSYLISFTFDEKDAKKSAEWVVDPENNIFTPISELATAVQKQENTN
jgi:hypothetical protein